LKSQGFKFSLFRSGIAEKFNFCTPQKGNSLFSSPFGNGQLTGKEKPNVTTETQQQKQELLKINCTF